MKRRGFTLGADLGGTWLRLCLADADGRVVRSARAPAPSRDEIKVALKRQLRVWGKPKLDQLVLGSAGLWRRGDQRITARRLRGLARRIRVISDLELAHTAAFAGKAGVLVIAGTGSAALARDVNGRFNRVGGWGPLLGDEGSAFWLGREALKDPALSRWWPDGLALKLAHEPLCVRKTAALARTVLTRAGKNAAARALRRRAAAELAALVESAVLGLRVRGPWPACAHGSLLSDAGLSADLRARLPRGRYRFQSALMPAERAAATLY